MAIDRYFGDSADGHVSMARRDSGIDRSIDSPVRVRTRSGRVAAWGAVVLKPALQSVRLPDVQPSISQIDAVDARNVANRWEAEPPVVDRDGSDIPPVIVELQVHTARLRTLE